MTASTSRTPAQQHLQLVVEPPDGRNPHPHRPYRLDSPRRSTRATLPEPIPFFETPVPCASGWALGIPVEIHLRDTLGRATVALHELHALAEAGLDRVAGDRLLAVAAAADTLAESLHEPYGADVAITIGTAFSNGQMRLDGTTASGCAVVVRRGDDHVALGTASTHRPDGAPGPDSCDSDVATASGRSALASVVAARRILGDSYSDGVVAFPSSANGLIVRADGTVEEHSLAGRR